MRWGAILSRLSVVAVATAFAAAPLPAAAQESLPGEGEGKRIVETLCAACHSLKMVTQQGMSRHRWDETLVWMVEKQGMPDLPDDMRTEVLDYLAEHFGTDHRPDGGSAPPMAIGTGVQPLMPAN